MSLTLPNAEFVETIHFARAVADAPGTFIMPDNEGLLIGDNQNDPPVTVDAYLESLCAYKGEAYTPPSQKQRDNFLATVAIRIAQLQAESIRGDDAKHVAESYKPVEKEAK